jgi:Spy/CpxP family protein refolding chaperone
MNMKLLITMSILGMALQFTPVARSQDDEQGKRGHRWEQRLANLSPEERQKLEAAHRQAMQDPAVQAAPRQNAPGPPGISRRHVRSHAQGRSVNSTDPE